MPVPLQQAQAEFFRTLGHPVRIRVPELLHGGPMPVPDLLTTIEGEPSTLSQQPAVPRRSDVDTSARTSPTVVHRPAGTDVPELTRAAQRTLTEKLSEQNELPEEPREAEVAAS